MLKFKSDSINLCNTVYITFIYAIKYDWLKNTIWFIFSVYTYWD